MAASGKFSYTPRHTLAGVTPVQTPMELWHRHLRNYDALRSNLKPPYKPTDTATLAESVIFFLLEYGYTHPPTLLHPPASIAAVLELCSHAFSPAVMKALRTGMELFCSAMGESIEKRNGAMLHLVQFADTGSDDGFEEEEEEDPCLHRPPRARKIPSVGYNNNGVVNSHKKDYGGGDSGRFAFGRHRSGDVWPETLEEWIYAFSKEVYLEFRRRVKQSRAEREAEDERRRKNPIYRLKKALKRMKWAAGRFVRKFMDL
ncbi:hypothetical protein Dda_7521 [Drechslerella dactyloides]|uniref:Uncharacterized protein n=1 Tax=Drechslerella dactyloides TaxID=74499 RepID=A0AAD6ISB0_DREDA|nr:hypothetical protein Dda_7521 [Drechslerella dactyloides]